MKTTVTLILVAVLSLSGSNFVFAQRDNLSGMYQCEGTSAGGEQYSGVVEIVKTDDTYLVRWIIPPDVYIGVGVVQGNTFSVSYAAGTLGLVVYTFESDSRLKGRWTTVTAGGQVFTETLTKTDAAAAPASKPPVVVPQSRPRRPSISNPPIALPL